MSLTVSISLFLLGLFSFIYYFFYKYCFYFSDYKNDVVVNIIKPFVIFLRLPMKKNEKLEIKKKMCPENLRLTLPQ